jgi:hypothetical protein
MSSYNQDFLNNRYISNNDIDINDMMSSVMDETTDTTFRKLKEELESANQHPNILLQAGVSNHTIFAQNMVKETTTGKFFKSGQMFLNNIECESNPGYLDISFLTTVFKTTQGLVELPIHTILKIGGIYDFYYYNDYEKDDKIDLNVVNGLKTKNGYDLFDDPIIKNKHYGTYVFDDKNLVLATAPFVKPISPKHIDDSVSNGSDSFSKTNVSKNYKEKYYDYDLEAEFSLSNNIASHMPFSGYGVLNNYMNAMSHFFFGKGLDGGTDITDTTNNDGIPYHIIGNFNGNLKTFKTYNDTQLNFLASYNSFGTKIKYDLNGLTAALNTLTKTITLDTNFVFSKSPKKTEFFLLLSKIKANYLGGYISTDYLYTLIKDLCGKFKDGSFLNNNLNAKHDEFVLSDFTALLIHLLFYPDGDEKDSRRPNKTLRILSLYDVDPNSFTQAIGYNTTTLLNLTNFLANIVNESPEKQYEQVTYLLLSLWSKESKEFNRDISGRLSAIDDKGTYVVYPSCGGEINIKELFSNRYYTYRKTNNTTTVIGANDLLDPYITGLTISSFNEYNNISNDILRALNFDYKTFYSNIPNVISSENPYTDILDIKGFGTLKYSQKATGPNSISDNDNFFLKKYDPYHKDGGLTTLDITNKMVTSSLDRYDDLYIIANTTEPVAIYNLNFNNNNLINNTSKLFWFDQTRNVFPIKDTYRSQNVENLIDKKVYDDYEVSQYGYGGDEKQLYYIYNIIDYSKFEKDKYFYFSTKGVTTTNSDVNKQTIESVTTAEIDALIDIFGVDKLEDFRSLFKNFTDKNTGNYFTETFNTFNFQSLIKHTNIFGYKHLPGSVKLGDIEYTKDEISAFLCGYSGHFIEFASKNDVSKIINYALTIGQENKAKIVIDEFMNAKITINNYSTTGPLYVDNTLNNPKGLRLNSNIFNPIIMYATETRTPDNIIAKLDYRLLFRTLLFGDQPIKSYDVKTIPDNFNTLVDKYLGSHELYSVEPTLEKILLPELTKIFFSELNIEITEGNLKLLLAYLKSYINNYIGSEEKSIISPNGFNITGIKITKYRNATTHPSSENEEDKDFDYTRNEYVVTNRVINGVLTKVGEVKYLFNTIDELKPVEKLREFIDYTNRDILTKQIEAFNTGLEKFSELAKSKIDTLPALEDSKSKDEKWDEKLKKQDIELRTGTYYRIKTLYDRSVSFNNIDLNDTSLIKKTNKELAKIDVNAILNQPLFFNFNIETDDNDYENCNDKNIIADKDGGKLKDLYDYAFVLDRGNNDYGSKVLANIDGLKKVIADDLTNVTQVDNTLRSKSMWSVLSTLATDHEFLLMPLTSYINLNGAVKNTTDPFELAHDMFGVFNNLEMFDSNPAFIFQLGSLTSNVSAGNKQKKNSFSEFDLSNTFCMDIETNQLDSEGRGKILDEGIPNDILNSNVSSFIVDFGNKNQNMFQNIQLSTDEFANTEESIFTQVNLTSDSGNIAQLSTGKLFTAMENRSYSCTVTSLGNASIQPLTYFYVKNVPLFYGTYWITNVSHKITPNNMTTTFKGVRQPIAKKPTANTSILKQLIKKAVQNFESTNYVDTNNPVSANTDGRVYFSNRAEGKFGLFAQEVKGVAGKYVAYYGDVIVGAYLSLMTNRDQSNTLLIKALIAYLYNNASLLANSDVPADASKYFLDIIIYDLTSKIGKIENDLFKAYGSSLSKLLKDHPTQGTVYETMLSEFNQKSLADVFEYLKHDKPITGVKTTLITSIPRIGGVVLPAEVVGDDSARASITYPDDIAIPSTATDLFRGASYWVSDKPANNFNELAGFNRFFLTNSMFTTKNPALTPVVAIRGSTLPTLPPPPPVVVLGFGNEPDTTPVPYDGKFKYGAKPGNTYIPANSSVVHRADVLGAISNGNSYISFLAIAPETEISKFANDRSARSYINKAKLTDTDPWTILEKKIDQSNIYNPPNTSTSNNSGGSGNNSGNNSASAGGSFSVGNLVLDDKDFWQLVAVSLAESYFNQLQSIADVAQSIYNRVNLQIGGLYGNTISGAILASGQYEPVTRARKFNDVKNKESAIDAYMEYLEVQAKRVGKRNTVTLQEAGDRIDKAVEIITDRAYIAEAASFVGSRTEFLADRPTRSNARGEIYRNPASETNVFYWDYSGRTLYLDKSITAASPIPSNLLNFRSGNQSTSSSPAQSQSTSSNAGGKAVTIGDSISIGVDRAYANINGISSPVLLNKSGEPSSWLLSQLDKIQNPFNDVKTVVLSIGSNNGWNLDSNGVDKKLAEKIKEVFPNAYLYILNGSYGWSRYLRGGSDGVWEDKINKYTKFYEDKGFSIIGDVKPLKNHPTPGDDLFKTFEISLGVINL